MFTNCDREEREIFTAFTNAIRDSHEKQRAQLEYTKYFGLILSIAGSFLAFTYSSLRKNDLKHFIAEHIQEISANPQQSAVAGPSSSVLENIQRNQKNSEEIMKTIVRNHQQLMYAFNKDKSPPSILETIKPVSNTINLNEMPDGEKLLWFSVLSLVGLMILKKLFN